MNFPLEQGVTPLARRRADYAEARLRRQAAMTAEANDPLLDLRTVREMLGGIGESTMRGWLKSGALRSIRLGRQYFVRLSEVKRMTKTGVQP